MKILRPQPSLADQVYDVIVDEICDGDLPAGTHLKQEQLAERLGVSRQPVQQAMALLKADGLVEEKGRRGLAVAPLDRDLMLHHYGVRAALDGMAARMTAARVAADAGVARAYREKADAVLEQGNEAVEARDVTGQVRHDIAFHTLAYEMSGNPLLAKTAEPHWRFLRRAMAEVMRSEALPGEIWRQHAGIAEAIAAGEPERAEALMIEHDLTAADTLYKALEDRT